MWIFSCWDKSWPFQLQKLRFWIKSAFSGEFLVVEEEKTYCSDQEALCMEALHWNKRFEKQNASNIYFKRLPIAQLIDAVYKRSQRWYLSSAPENVRQLWSDLFIFSEGLNGWAMIRICKTVHWSHQLSQHSVNNIIWVTEMGLQWNKHVDIQSMIFTSESTMVVQLVVGGDGVQLHLCERRWMVRQGEGNNLLVEWTHKALCEGTTSRLAIGTCRHLESYHKVLLEGGENYLEEELHKNKSLEGWLWSQGRAV